MKKSFTLFVLALLCTGATAQNYQWAKSIGSISNDGGYSMAVDSFGNTYLTGYFGDTADFDPGPGTTILAPVGLEDIFFAKFDAFGNFLWAKSIGSTNNDYGQSIAIDVSGNIYLTGFFFETTADFDPGPGTAILTSNGNWDIFFAKYDNNGNYLWAKNIGSTGSDNGFGLAVDVLGNIYLSGFFTYTVDFDPSAAIANLIAAGNREIFFAKYDNNGNYLWAKNIGNTDYEESFSLAIDASGNVYLTGYFEDTVDFDPGAGIVNLISSGLRDIFFAKYGSNGLYLWAKNIGSASNDVGYSITTDSFGNIYVTGYFEGTADFDPSAGTQNISSIGSQDIFFAKYDSNGNYLWAKNIGSANGDVCSSITLDGSGNVYVTGRFQDTADFDPGPGIYNLISPGGISNTFISKLDNSGNFVWAKQLGNPNNGTGKSIVLDVNGNQYITGYFQNIGDFDPGPGTANLTSNGGYDIFFAKYSPPCFPTYTDTIALILHDGINCIDYPIVKIGSQWWMKENVNATLYSDSTPLIDGTGAGDITGNYTTKYYFNYGDNPANSDVYGKLYTWAAAMNGAASSDSIPSGVQGVCPTGWHLPGDAEWKQLELYLGMTQAEVDATQWRGDKGHQLKETGASHWSVGCGTNTTGLTALPDGYRWANGTYSYLTTYGYLWTATEATGMNGWLRNLACNQVGICRVDNWSDKDLGVSVRCVKDVALLQPLTASISNVTNVTCNGGTNGSATVTAIGGTPPYSYLWSTSPAQTGSVATGLVAGTYAVTVTEASSDTATAIATITEPPALTVTPTPTAASCYGVCDGAITATASGGITPYTYFGTGTNLCAGFHSIQVTDANGCTVLSSATITEPAAITIAFSTTDVPCYGYCNGSITATVSNGTSPFTYLWSTGATGNPINGLCAGTYQVTVTDANNCSATATATITEPQAISIAISSTAVTCYGSCNASATATVSGGTSPYGYSWSNGSTVSAVTGLCAGTYTVTVVDAAMCGGTTSTTTITEPPALTVAPSVTDVTCNGSCDGSASVSVSGGVSPYTYIWSNSTTTNPATGLCTGSYGVTVTDANGCTASSSATITEPPVINTPVSATICSNDSILLQGNYQTTAGTYYDTLASVTGCDSILSTTLTVNPIPPAPTASSNSPVNTGDTLFLFVNPITGSTYSWSGPNGFSSTSQNPTITGVAVANSGTYSVTATVNGCTGPAGTTSVTVITIVITTTTTNVSCNGGSNGAAAVVSASGGTAPYTYSWSTTPAQTTQAIFNLSAGTFTVTVSDTSGSSATATVNITQPSAISIFTNPTNVSCYGGNDGTAQAIAGGGISSYTYSWNSFPVQTTATASNLSSGNYSITVTDANTCTSTSTVAITQPSALTVTFGIVNANCASADGSATANVTGGTASYSYLWSNGQTNSVAAAVGSGSYTVTVTDANGCTVTSVATVGFIPSDFNLAFSATPQNGVAPLAVTFTNSTPVLSNYNFTWYYGDGNSVSNNSATVFYTYNFAGTYDVALLATHKTNGCTDTLLKQPYINVTGTGCTHTATVSPAGPLSACQGDTVTLTPGTNASSPFLLQWNINSTLISGATDSTLAVTQSGYYSVTVIKNSCPVTSAAVQVTFATQPQQPTITSAGTITPCVGGSVTLTSSSISGVTYLWNTGETTLSITVSNSGDYSVMVTNGSGCSAASAPFTVNASLAQVSICLVTVDSLSQNNIIVWEKQANQPIDSFIVYREISTNNYQPIGAVPYDSLSEFIDTVRTKYFPNTGDPNVTTYRYKIVARDTCGNYSALSAYHNTIYIINNNNGTFFWPQLYTIEGSANPVNNYILMRDDNSTGNWQIVNNTAGTQQIVSDPAYTTYKNTATWRVETDWGISCTATLQKLKTYNASKSNTAAQGIITNESALRYTPEGGGVIYPNPNNGKFLITTNNHSTIAIYNVLGEKVFQSFYSHLSLGNSPTAIDLSSQPEGIYFVQLTASDKVYHHKIVISKTSSFVTK